MGATTSITIHDVASIVVEDRIFTKGARFVSKQIVATDKDGNRFDISLCSDEVVAVQDRGQQDVAA